MQASIGCGGLLLALLAHLFGGFSTQVAPPPVARTAVPVRQHVRALVDIPCGTRLQAEQLAIAVESVDTLPDDVIVKLEDAVGLYSRIKISARSVITESMLTDDKSQIICPKS
jgi:flagella basal body P-ring formation protein FlgA